MNDSRTPVERQYNTSTTTVRHHPTDVLLSFNWRPTVVQLVFYRHQFFSLTGKNPIYTARKMKLRVTETQLTGKEALAHT